ncbi:MAG: glycosyltransferase [Desulfobacter sp.]|nr:MAG: glycosyltransferase [Desulfobacter sp.]
MGKALLLKVTLKFGKNMLSDHSDTVPIKVLQLGSPMGLFGAERWILALIRHLNPVVIDSFVGVVKDDSRADLPDLYREAGEQGFKTVMFHTPGRVNLKSVTQLRRFIFKQKIQILHTHGYKQDAIGYLATRGTGCKIVSTPHGWSKNADFKLMCYEMLDRALFPFLDVVSPLSRELERNLLFLGRKLHYIGNGVDISEVDSHSGISEKMELWRKKEYFIIGYIGQLIPRKGIDILLRAVSELKEIPWRLAIVGSGEQKEYLCKLSEDLGISSQVRFFGFRDDRLSFLKGFDVFILPSRLEGIPRCLMEAMAAKVPIVASDIPGSNDLIDHNVNGLLFPEEDHATLGMTIERLSRDPRIRRSLALKARKDVEIRFSAVRMAREYEDLFKRLIA